MSDKFTVESKLDALRDMKLWSRNFDNICFKENGDMVIATLDSWECDPTHGEVIRNFIERIEAELSERYMELPVDADGVPILIGDELVLQYEVMEKPSEVESITFDGDDWYFTSSDGFFNTAGFHHVKPRTIEDVLGEFAARVLNSGHKWGLDAQDTIADCAEEIRGIIEGETE